MVALRTPLHDAVLGSDHLRIRKLLEGGAETERLDDLGMTPLLWAVFRGDTEAVDLLIRHGADPNTPSLQGTTPLWHAEDDFGLWDIAELLRRYGANA